MPQSLVRLTLGLAVLLGLMARMSAQDKPPAKGDVPPKIDPSKEEYREFFKAPETAEDFWTALQFEMELGRYELGAKLLRGLIARKPTDEDLIKLEEKAGSFAPFLRLRAVPRWSEDKGIHDQALKDADELAQRVGDALRRVYGDRKRIARLVKDLNGDRDERSFATRELYRAKDLAVPPLVEALRQAEGEQREAIVSLLPRLAPDTVAPLLAALDISDDALRMDLVNVLLRRAERDTAPHLWPLAGSAKVTPPLRTLAQRALATLLDRPADALQSAPVALAHEAERYYRHEVKFANPDKVPIWRWDGKELVQGWPGIPTVSASRAEEYYGLRFARQALELDPSSAEAQEVFLLVALDKAVERAGLDKPLAAASPDMAQLLATVSPDLLVRALERGLADRRPTVLIGAVRALSDLQDPRAIRAGRGGDPPLLRALNFPDRRVQMAAAEAILRIPTDPSPQAASRVVEVLRRNLTAEPSAQGRPRILLGFANDELNNLALKAAQKAGFDAVTVRSGREALQRLEAAADIDAMILDTALPDPGLAPMLAQLRAGTNYGLLPLWLTLPANTQESLRRQRVDLGHRLLAMRQTRQGLLAQKARIANTLERKGDPGQAEAVRQELEQIDKQLGNVSSDRETALADEDRLIGQEFLRALPDRQRTLERLLARASNTWLLPQAAALTASSLSEVVMAQLADAGSKPLTEAERKDFAERSLAWLVRIARGELRGYDIRPVEDALYGALRSASLTEGSTRNAIEAVGRLPSAKAQTELVGVVLDAKRPVPLRSAAAAALQGHIQRHTSALGGAQVRALEELVAAKETDVALRAGTALVIGSTRPGARQTGERLKGFDPQIKPPAPPVKDEKE